MFPSDAGAFGGADEGGDIMMDGGAAEDAPEAFAGDDSMAAFGGADDAAPADGADGYEAPDAGAPAPAAAVASAAGRPDTSSAINPMA